MQGISDKCGLESCRFCEAGRCADQEQRRQCLAVLLWVVSDPADREAVAHLDNLDSIQDIEINPM